MREVSIPHIPTGSHQSVAFLNSNAHNGRTLLFQADGPVLRLQAGYGAWEGLKEAMNKHSGWWVIVLGYDLKNELELLQSPAADRLGFPDLLAFRADQVWEQTGNEWSRLEGEAPFPSSSPVAPNPLHVTLRPRIERAAYLQDVARLQAHIQRGDIYEVNYCQEFFAQGVVLDPWHVYRRLNAHTRAPFSAFVRSGDAVLMSGSPERFMMKRGQRVISQPIKGTAPRGSSTAEDAAIRHALINNPKERSENIMITDLVRNDLSKTAVRGSVQVEELVELHSFETVHQLISTVSSTVSPALDPVDLIRSAFPMGSMTGAPKVSAMQLIDQTEQWRRGWYSGAVGYCSPEGDFDFNVIIRSLLYRPSTGYLSAGVGGAITALSDPEAEYNECMLKLDALQQALRDD